MKALRSADGLAFAALILGALALGWAPIGLRFSDAGPVATAFWRFVIGFPFILAIALGEARLTPPPAPGASWRDWTGPAALGGIAFALDFALWHPALTLTSVTNATLFSNFAPIVVVILVWIFLRKAPPALFLVGLGLALTGSCLLAFFGAEGRADRASRLLGDLLAIGTAFWYALYMLAMRQARAKGRAFAVMSVVTLVGAGVLFVVSRLVGETLLPQSPQGWAAVISLGLVCQVVAQCAVIFSLGRIEAAPAAVMLTLQPIAAAIMAWVLFDERLSASMLAAAALTLIGVVTAQLAHLRAAPRRA